MGVIDDAKRMLDKQVAAFQAQVGEFLTLKNRIYHLPTADMERLMPVQQALETEATDLGGRAVDLKARVSAMTLLDITKTGSMMAEATSLSRQAASLVDRMRRQKAEVEALEGKAPAVKTAGVSPLLMAGGAVAAYVWWRGRSRPR